jgi:hypothetical protein
MMLAEVRGKVSDRKHRLFACGSSRHFWHLFTEQSKHAIEVSEKVADGRATLEELAVVHNGAAHGQTEREAWLAFQASLPKGTLAAFSVTQPGFCKAARTNYQFSETWPVWKKFMCDLLRDVVGNPFRKATANPLWLAWNDGTVVKLADGIYEDRAFDRLPILADALEEAGCNDADILGHCRSGGEHVRGCWVVDLILGKT